MQKRPYLVSLAIILILAWYYFIFRAFPITLGFVNAVVAFASTFIISLSFLFGPLAKFVKFFGKYLHDRKDYGLIGFGLAALHTFLAVPNMLSNNKEILLADAGSLAFAAIAFAIFILMALTSTNEWMQSLGYNNWKNLQRTGYLAFLFVAFHIVLLESGIFLTRTIGMIALSVILGIILLRIIASIFGMPALEKIKV